MNLETEDRLKMNFGSPARIYLDTGDYDRDTPDNQRLEILIDKHNLLVEAYRQLESGCREALSRLGHPLPRAD